MTLRTAFLYLIYAILTAIAMVVLWPYIHGMNVVQVGAVAVCLIVGFIITDC